MKETRLKNPMPDRISLAGRISGDLTGLNRNGEAEGSQSRNATGRSLL